MIMMKIMIMMKRMMIMKGGREGTPGGGAGAGRGSSAGPRWAADFGGLWLNEIPEKKMSYLSHRCPRSSASHRAGDFDANLTAGLHKPAIVPPIARSKGANRLILIRALVVHPRNW